MIPNVIAIAWFCLLAAQLLSSAIIHAAEYDINIYSGKRAGPLRYLDFTDRTYHTDSMRGVDKGMALHIKPYDFPISFGFFAETNDYTMDHTAISQSNALARAALSSAVNAGEQLADFSLTSSSVFSGYQLGPEIKVWWPAHFFSPYVSVSAVYGTGTITAAVAGGAFQNWQQLGSLDYYNKQSLTITGPRASLGVTIIPHPIYRMSIEYNMDFITMQRNQAVTNFQLNNNSTQIAKIQLDQSIYPRTEERYLAGSFRVGIGASL